MPYAVEVHFVQAKDVTNPKKASPTDIGVAGVQLSVNSVLLPTQSEGGESGHLSFITPGPGTMTFVPQKAGCVFSAQPTINGMVWADPLHAPSVNMTQHLLIEWAVSEVNHGS